MAKEAAAAAVAGRPYWREADAQVLVDAWRRSGETLARFTRRYGLDRRRLGRWVSRLEAAGKQPVRFHPVRLVEHGPESGNGKHIEIRLANGQWVRVPPGFQAEDLRRVLAVLGEGVPC